MIECVGADPTGADTQYANAARRRLNGVGTLRPPTGSDISLDLGGPARRWQIPLEGEVPTPIIRPRHLKGFFGSRSGMGSCNIGQRARLA
jgi:hypothetical protein